VIGANNVGAAIVALKVSVTVNVLLTGKQLTADIAHTVSIGIKVRYALNLAVASVTVSVKIKVNALGAGHELAAYVARGILVKVLVSYASNCLAALITNRILIGVNAFFMRERRTAYVAYLVGIGIGMHSACLHRIITAGGDTKKSGKSENGKNQQN
jgi:hypothetical protein